MAFAASGMPYGIPVALSVTVHRLLWGKRIFDVQTSYGWPGSLVLFRESSVLHLASCIVCKASAETVVCARCDSCR